MKKPAHYLSDNFSKLESLHNYNRWIFDNMKEFITGDVLEIGCGTGILTDYIIGRSATFTGLDIERGFVCRARKKYAKDKKVRIICGDFMKTPFAKKFDTVILVNVLEHIKDDARAVKKIHSLLKKGGRIIVMVPAWQAAFGKIDENFGHYRRYSRARLKSIYSKAGLAVERLFYMNFIGAFGWYFNTRILKTEKLPGNQARAVNFFVPAMKFFENIVKPPLGQSLIAVGRK